MFVAPVLGFFEDEDEDEDEDERVDYVGQIFRPPSEAHSLLIQVTVGCSHNRCSFCAMYRDKRFRLKDREQVFADIDEAARHGRGYRRVFLCDGDVLTLSTGRLLPILERIRERLPWIERASVYGDTRCVANKSVDELVALREAGLGIVYHGLESGDDEVLRRIDKGGNRAEAVAMAAKLKEAGLRHSVIVLLGIGGTERSAEHAAATAATLSEMNPDYIGALVTMVLPGTPLWDEQQAGRYELPDKFGMLEELRAILAGTEVSGCRFSSNHASNYLPLRGDLPRDRAAMIAAMDRVLSRRDESMLKPEFLRGL